MKHNEIKNRVSQIVGLPEYVVTSCGVSSGTNFICCTFESVEDKRTALHIMNENGVFPNCTKDHHKRQIVSVNEYSFKRD